MTAARRIVVSGRVQGVGFRPFVYRLAHDLGVKGTVRNGAGRVFIEAEGAADILDAFTEKLIAAAPPLSRPAIAETAACASSGTRNFEIVASQSGETPMIALPPDLFLCDDCLAELMNPAERRAGYPFINCTQCGPRYTIIESLPYDRPNTSMNGFPLCPDCRAEYENPRDRRFHAEPLACAVCGPTLFFTENGRKIMGNDAALGACVTRLRSGGIVAVKGVGGYHLMCDPKSDDAISRLRERKHRPTKPFAVMFPFAGTDGLDVARRYVEFDEVSATDCASPERPIVLAKKKSPGDFSQDVAPGLSEFGVFLPYAPLHFLLLAAFDGPLIATSGNVSGEPVLTDNDEAEQRLGAVADAFLHHDRPIVRPADDSVVRVIKGAARPIRLGRGMAPAEISLSDELRRPVIAAGGHMKNAIALGVGVRAIVSPHIGDLDSPRSVSVFERSIADLQRLYGVSAEAIICDAHEGYASTRWARNGSLPVISVQHHRAHASALAGEHPHSWRWLTFTWDGVGLGDDKMLWGGEAFLGRPGAWKRVASWRPFHLSGGDKAGREPWRSAAALLWEDDVSMRFKADPDGLARSAWRRGANVYESSAVGRLFDAAACLVLGIEKASFEGEGPMMLESIADDSERTIELPMTCDAKGVLRSDWAPLLEMLRDKSIEPAKRAGIFHASLAGAIGAQARLIARQHCFDAIGLAGGVFQNRKLAELAIALLGKEGFSAFLPKLTPANDGGLAFGQIVEAGALMRDDAI